MFELLLLLSLIALAAAWVGHACLWVSVMSNLYGRPISKKFLKLWRLVTGGVILAFPWVVALTFNPASWVPQPSGVEFDWFNGTLGRVLFGYEIACLIVGGVVFPAITVARLLRKPPPSVVAESTRTLDLWPELGEKLVGHGHLPALTRLPGNGVFRVDFTDLTLSPPNLPPEWDGLTIHVVSDLHFHGTPARPFYDRVIDELCAGPTPDLVCLIGDYVDSDTHHEWIRPVLGRLAATGARLAILGNHDAYHDPPRVRTELEAAGYAVLGNGWRELTVSGVRCVAVGHEGPWFTPPDLSAAPPDLFRLCLSHTPDNFYWGVANRVGLMLCGHVHGGAIRVPVVGSIFVPSVYGRRFDMGVFERGSTVMVVGRGLSGREPVRFRCNPQVLRVKLVRRPAASD